MSDPVLRGSCLCTAVRYELRPPFIRFAHCYCSRCRKATGGVRSTNIAVVPHQFRWVSGEELISRYDLPEARSFARQICKRCNCPCLTSRAAASKSLFRQARLMTILGVSRRIIEIGVAE